MLPADAPPIEIETRFGVFRANRRDVVVLIDPLPGFEGCRRYVVLSSAAIAPFTCLQGLEGARPSFLAVSPHVAEPAYQAAIGSGDRLRIGAKADAPLLWLALVRLESDRAFVNLRAPLVINPERMAGVQLLDGDSDYPVDAPLPLA